MRKNVPWDCYNILSISLNSCYTCINVKAGFSVAIGWAWLFSLWINMLNTSFINQSIVWFLRVLKIVRYRKITQANSPTWHHYRTCFVKPTVQTSKLLKINENDWNNETEKEQIFTLWNFCHEMTWKINWLLVSAVLVSIKGNLIYNKA